MAIVLRLLRQSLLILFLISLLIAGAAWMLLQGSMPQYNGIGYWDRLTAPVTIERDTLGSVTVRAQDRLDLARALGYVHAQERFFEMDLMRRRAAGELSELFGLATVAADRKARKFRMRARAATILQKLPSKQRQLLNAYRDGVNRGLNKLSIRPFAYLLTRTHPAIWQSEDSLLVILAMYFTLNDSSIYRELALSTMHATLPKTAYQFLTATGGSWDAPLIGTALDWPQPPSADKLNIHTLDPALLQNHFTYNDHMPGSNSFAVSGELTDGAALVANDMHLELCVPNLWFRTRLIYPKQHHAKAVHDISGVSLPGVPIIIAGSNRHIAWSFTNSYGDFADWVRVKLHPEDSSRYRNKAEWKPIKTYHEVLQIRNAPDETLIIHETEWGPILATDHDKTPLALAWTALHPDAVNLTLAELEQTETANAAIMIAQNAGIPAQNFIVGDREGSIIWTIAGRIPIRTNNYDPRLPADWSMPNTGWNGWLDATQYPLIHNPASHRLWSANARTVTGSMLTLLGDGGYDLGARAKQIRDDLYARDYFTPMDMLAIQLDHRALFLTRWKQLLEETLDQSANTNQFHDIKQSLEDWNGLASTTSVAYYIVHAFRQEVIQRVLDGFAAAVRQNSPGFKLPQLNQAEHAVWILIKQHPPHLLPPGYRHWEDLLQACIAQVAKRMRAQPGGVSAQNWGKYNAAHIQHPLSPALPAPISNWLNMPADPLPGDNNMPRVQTPSFGASQRSAVEPGNEEYGYFDMPGGQSGHPLSPYYGGGHTNWITGKPTPFLPGPAEKVLQLHPS
ncbi:penicillin amidase [Nitrosomonas cryotolerans]|uniref:Penicillin amidase n=2 Tax=Nitrosomonas cryotolerans TaxID=44575 RepID=A0A1N6IJ70_9PROT|nr:penicillin acylase family protein [Nitrosomonas cryotolerans]SFP93848.1 penicillin amidase [Nitrosomonas cryotolerans]SIO32094.1 penicillin amidase [Nitrosomonas cryotolerans ATCC 49181]